MRRYILFCFWLIMSTSMIAQVYVVTKSFDYIPKEILNDIDKMGVDGYLSLTDLEGKYINAIFQVEADINLSRKKVCFLTDSTWTSKSDKRNFFMMERARMNSASAINYAVLYVFNSAQKERSGGYDAAIVSWSRKFLSVKEVIKRSRRLHQVYIATKSFENVPKEVLSDFGKMGVDECLSLTDLEGKYFNALFQVEADINLSGKKVCFLTGNIGTNKSDKKKFFMMERESLNFDSSPNYSVLYVFNAAQKERSGGYDAAIVSWSKKFLSVEEVIKRLRKFH